METGLGYSKSTISLKSGYEQTFIQHHDLGIREENSYTLFITPSEDELTELENHALDASLELIVENIEIARFDLKKQ